MEILKYLYENPPKINNFLPRKLQIDTKFALLFGAPLCGKSTLAIAHLSRFDKFLYVDLDDIRARIDLKIINEFVLKFQIKALCIDNATSKHLKDLERIKQQCKEAEILIISKDLSLKIDGFKNFYLRGLDYEEFIAFFKRNFDESTIFAHFMDLGNSPFNALNAHKNYLKQAIFSKISPQKRQIMANIANKCAENFSALSSFNELKNELKISKDSFYNELLELKNLGLIEFLEIFSQQENKRLKRVYFSDFALRGVFSFSKNPRALILNMLYCQLASKAVYFAPNLDFYLHYEKLGIIVAPFLSPDLCLMKIKKHLKDYQKLNLNEIIVISNSANLSQILNGIKISILPFWRFVAGF